MQYIWRVLLLLWLLPLLVLRWLNWWKINTKKILHPTVSFYHHSVCSPCPYVWFHCFVWISHNNKNMCALCVLNVCVCWIVDTALEQCREDFMAPAVTATAVADATAKTRTYAICLPTQMLWMYMEIRKLCHVCDEQKAKKKKQKQNSHNIYTNKNTNSRIYGNRECGSIEIRSENCGNKTFK